MCKWTASQIAGWLSVNNATARVDLGNGNGVAMPMTYGSAVSGIGVDATQIWTAGQSGTVIRFQISEDGMTKGVKLPQPALAGYARVEAAYLMPVEGFKHEVPVKFAVTDSLNRRLTAAYADAGVDSGLPVTLAYDAAGDDPTSGYTGIRKMVALTLGFP